MSDEHYISFDDILNMHFANDHDATNDSNMQQLHNFVRATLTQIDPVNHLFVAAMPKSGSTFLCRALEQLTGYLWYPMTFAYFQNEHDLYLPYMLRAISTNTVTQQHCRATDVNIKLMQAFDMRAVVMVRNIHDLIISYFDHLHRQRVRIPGTHLNEQFYELDTQTKLDLIIDMIVPWYISFYVSWFDAELNQTLPMMWLTYETLLNDPAESVKRVLNFHNIDAPLEVIREVTSTIDPVLTGKNVAKTGRGMEQLSAEQLARVSNFKRYYPWADFSRIGIT
jgi:hypothetical protein